jgi:CubicO group peptidase (beta-lactamase class C family)
VTVLVEGRTVVDLWTGWQDSARTRPWRRDTLVDVFSVGKAMAAVCLLILVQRGQIDLDAPVARHWPEFAAAGKDGITVRMLLSHQAGLPAIHAPLPDEALYDWTWMVSALADTEPWWPPGHGHGYHVNTFGFLVGELVRRVGGCDIGEFFRTTVAGPLGADFHFGLDAGNDHRTAEFLFGDDLNPATTVTPPGDASRLLMLKHAYFNPAGVSGIGTVNTRAWRAALIPSANGHGTARAVAGIYAALIAGDAPILRPDILDEARTECVSGPDLVLGRPSRFGLGFQLTQPERPIGPNPNAFGHFGAGGSLGFADPDAGIAFGYVMNRAGPRWQSPRTRALLDALYACL